MGKAEILKNLEALQAEILKNVMDPASPPQLLPVTKFQPVASIRVLKDAGISQIGENRVQEIMGKYAELNSDFSVHLIGRLQTNKIKYIMGKVCMVQSLDRLALAQALDMRAQSAGIRLPVLVEVNIGGESQKAGIDPGEIEAFARAVARMDGLSLRGLMAMMPMADDAETLRPMFRKMRGEFEQLRDLAIAGTQVDTLSMGMSGDWKVAAQEGATLLRIGSAIFGQRPPLAINR